MPKVRCNSYNDAKLTSCLVFEEEEDPSNRSFFSEIISSISDVKFSRDGRYILSRDYLSLKIWDTTMESRPIRTIQIHDHLRGKLCDLYENDCIFDKFECTFSGDGRSVICFGNLIRQSRLIRCTNHLSDANVYIAMS